jgi:hypothetical protein
MLRVCLGWVWMTVALVGVLGEERQPRKSDMMPYTEFDFSPLPQGGMGVYKLQLTILTEDKDIKLSELLEFARGADPNTNCEFLAAFLNRNKFKAEVVDKTKVRVYGRVFNDKLIPVTKGMVESKDLRPEELPKVKNPEQKG